MPVKLIVALALLALATAMQVMHIADGNGTIPGYVNLALKLFLVVGLLRGSESARTLALVVGVLNVLVGILAVFQVGALITYLPLTLQLQLAVPLVFGAYLLWCMSREDVKTWLYKRAFAGVADD
ncbi:hypothetical protein SAMN02745121_03274 [Nannocystis exedens]|uniref:Uncharacterized protein n=1 Tax=Nannocystis exedens TaxID=54 RepID=A0A1I1YBZ0_9BACT|nr:hypothetical protein [Nannocystis exedens]PCC71924.1 hypothetical protein NAEX_05003 [Nannocystis exedens]SFE16508.1 hypothetical protein SAMN02745121_03274 [Nannocystis exedens]